MNRRTLRTLCLQSAICLICCLTPSAYAHTAAESPETPLGDCTEELVRGQFLGPPERMQIRALVTRLSGVDDASRRFGIQVGQSLKDALAEYAQRALGLEQDGLSSRNVRVKFIPCVIPDHDRARIVGQAAGADVVLWGQTFCDWRKPEACQKVDLRGAIINSYNGQKASPKAQMKNRVEIRVPKPEEPESAFKTSLTVVNWVGLEANGQGAFTVKRTSELAYANLPRLASSRPRLLLDFSLGLYAFRAERFRLAAEFFRRSQDSIAAGIEGVQKLYLMMGWSYIAVGERDRGLQALQQALSVCQPTDDECRSTGLQQVGWGEDQLDRTQEALGHYREALELMRKRGDRGGEAGTLNDMGLLYNELGERHKALEAFNQALSIHRQIGDRDGEGTTLNGMAVVYGALSDRQKALEVLNQALPLFREVGNRGKETTILNNIGSLYDVIGDQQKALEVFNQALPLVREVGDLAGEAAILNNIGHAYEHLGEKQKALEYYNQALPMFRKVGSGRGEASALTNIGRVFAALGEKQKALEYYNQALPIRRQAGDRSGEAITLRHIGLVYFALGEKQKALEYYNQALPIHREAGDRGGEAITLSNVGRVYDALGEKQKALELFNQALPILKQVGDISAAGSALDAMAASLAALRQIPEAIARYQDAAAMYRRRNPPDLDGARASLRSALELAQRHHMEPQAQELLRALDVLH